MAFIKPDSYYYWGKSHMIVPETTLKTVAKHEPKFYASYETDGSTPNIYCLLQNAYGKQWRLEHNAFIMKKKARMNIKVSYDPLVKARAIAKARREKEQKISEENERIRFKFKHGRSRA